MLKGTDESQKVQLTVSRSLSRPRLVPRGGTELPRSPSCSESRSDAPGFFAPGLAFFVEASTSRRMLAASSRLSSVALRRRSSRTQSSQL